MSKTLAIAVRFYEGRYHGVGAWPPDPARLFQALVAGSAVSSKSLPCGDRDALIWLEKLGIPKIGVPKAKKRIKSIVFFVPNNDCDVRLDSGLEDSSKDTLTSKLQPCRLFNPEQPLIYFWDLADDDNPPEDLVKVVHRLYRLGRGVDPAYAEMMLIDTSQEVDSLLRKHRLSLYLPTAGSDCQAPCDGTLMSLEKRHAAFTIRLNEGENEIAFKQPPRAKFSRLFGYSETRRVRRFYYYLRNTEPDMAGRFKPEPVHKAATICDLLLEQAKELLKDHLDEGQMQIIERQLLGRGAEDADKPARVRLLPTPTMGHDEADTFIRRVLVEIPYISEVDADDLDWALTTLKPIGNNMEPLGWSLERCSGDDGVFSLLLSTSLRWRSLTPMALPKGRSGRKGRKGVARRKNIEDAAKSVRQSLRHAGLREEITRISIQAEPFHRRGIRAQAFETPKHIDAAQLANVELHFANPVKGPLVLGDGRFRGLGIFEPVMTETQSNKFLFSLRGEEPINAKDVAAAARARALELIRTIHQVDGSDVKIFVDPERRHLLFTMQKKFMNKKIEDVFRQFVSLKVGNFLSYKLKPLHDLEAPLLNLPDS